MWTAFLGLVALAIVLFLYMRQVQADRNIRKLGKWTTQKVEEGASQF
jgi:hypothetical protein